MSTGIETFELSDWRHVKPVVDNVVATQAGLGTLLQHNKGVPVGNEVFRPATAQHCIHIWPDGVERPRLNIGGDRFEPHASGGASLFVPAGADYHSVRQTTANRTTQLVFIDANFTDDLINNGDVTRGADPPPMVNTPDTGIARLGKRMLALSQNPLGLSRAAWEALGVLLSLELIRLSDRGAVKPPKSGGLAPWQVNRIESYIQENISENVGLTELARLVDLSSFHFSRAYKQATGLSPQQRINQVRIDRAKRLLVDDTLSVGEVARAVGYRSLPSFSRMFSKALGVSPGEFRRH